MFIKAEAAQQPSISRTFARMMVHIRLAQTAEKAILDFATQRSNQDVTLTNVADQLWSGAYKLAAEISGAELEAKIERDYDYIDVAQLLVDLFDARPDQREHFADRAAEKRADLGPVHPLTCPDLTDGLKFVIWPEGLPSDNLAEIDANFGL